MMLNLKNSVMLKVFLSIVIGFLLNSCEKRTVEKTFFPGGQLKEEYQVIDGIKDGYYKLYYINGNLKEHYFYENGQFFSTKWKKTYYSDGRDKFHRYFTSGILTNVEAWETNGLQVVKNGTGTFIEYYPYGEKEYQFSFINGTIQDTVFNWYKNGNLREIQVFSKGKPIGIWKKWNHEGILEYSRNTVTGETYNSPIFD